MASKKRIAVYVASLIAYLVIVGLASSYNLVLGVTLLILPMIFFVYRWLSRRSGVSVRLPIVRLRKSYASSFYTDAPDLEVRYALALGEELGVKATAVLTRMPNTDVQAHKIILYTTALTDRVAKQKLSFAIRSVVSLLSIKGYRIVPDTNVDESLIAEGGNQFKTVFPIVIVFAEEDYGAAVSKAFDFADKFVLLSAEKPHILAALEVLPEQVWSHAHVLRFGYNFGFNLFAQNMDGGFISDVAEVCYGLSTESALVLASTISKANKEGQPLNPFLLGDILEAETQSRGLSSRVHDELYAFQESLKTNNVWRGLVKDHPPDLLPNLIVDLSQIDAVQANCFVMYTLAKSLAERGRTLVLDLTRFRENVVSHILNDLRLTHNTVFLLPKGRLKRDGLKGFGTLVYMGADGEFRKIVSDLNPSNPTIADNASYVLTRSGSLSPFSKQAAMRKVSLEELEKLINTSASPLEVEDISEKPYLPNVFKKEQLDSIMAALSYVEKYTTVEETTFAQALGLKTQSVEVTSKLVRLGYLKRKRKSGISFVELTARGHEELERLRRYINQT
jgi:DNA-binding MarR family transcriptional regulator